MNNASLRFRILLLATLCCGGLLALSINAADMYKYKDENGRWVFTDKKPAVKEYQTQHLLRTESKNKVAVINRGTKTRPILVAINKLHGPVELWLDFAKAKNIRFSRPAPHYWLLPAKSETVLLDLEPENRQASWSYQWQPNIVIGQPLELSQLKPINIGKPFVGGPFIISQGFKGQQSHAQHVEAEYAIDIGLPEGTPILASADGLVMETEKDFSRAGWGAKYADEANMVRLLHSDGTMTVYAHLAMDMIMVSEGETVKRGQLIAYSGNTGYSSGPHLHFVVQANRGRKLVSIPFAFSGEPDLPKQGQWIKGLRKPL